VRPPRPSAEDVAFLPGSPLSPVLGADSSPEVMYRGLNTFLAETTNVSVLVTDPQGRIVWCNKGFERISEYSFNEIRGLSPGVILQGPRTDPETVAFMSRKLRAGEPFQTEILNYSRTGREYWVAIEVHPVFNAEGELTNFTAIQYDITRHKDTELLSRQRERQQAALARLAQTALVDPEPETLLQQAAELTGETLEIGKVLILELLPGGQRLVPRAGIGWRDEQLEGVTFRADESTHPGQALLAHSPVVAADLERDARFADASFALEHGAKSGVMAPIDGPVWPFGVIAAHDTRARRFTVDDLNFIQSVASLVAQALIRAGAEDELRRVHAELEHRIELRTRDLREANSRLEEEIRERQRVEDALRGSETFLQSALDSLSAHIAILDEFGTILAVNKAWRVFAQDNDFSEESAALGMNYIDVCRSAIDAGSAESALMLRGIEDVLTGRRSHFFLQYPCHAPHQERWFQARVSRFTAAGERRLVIAHENITEAKEHERRMLEHMEALSHVQRLETMGEMSAALAHELNQPLGAINNYISGSLRRLERVEGLDEEIPEAMSLAKAEATRAADIIKRMRRFSRNAAIQRTATDVNGVVRETVSLVEPDARLRATKIRTELAGSLPIVLADVIHLQQVLINLIRNAMDAMSDTPFPQREIVVRSWTEEGRVFVSVADHGTGIDEQARARLFDPFVSTKSDGMGLGLAICRSIVEAHDGRIWADDNPDAESGARFMIAIPTAANQTDAGPGAGGDGPLEIEGREAAAG